MSYRPCRNTLNLPSSSTVPIAHVTYLLCDTRSGRQGINILYTRASTINNSTGESVPLMFNNCSINSCNRTCTTNHQHPTASGNVRVTTRVSTNKRCTWSILGQGQVRTEAKSQIHAKSPAIAQSHIVYALVPVFCLKRARYT